MRVYECVYVCNHCKFSSIVSSIYITYLVGNQLNVHWNQYEIDSLLPSFSLYFAAIQTIVWLIFISSKKFQKNRRFFKCRSSQKTKDIIIWFRSANENKRHKYYNMRSAMKTKKCSIGRKPKRTCYRKRWLDGVTWNGYKTKLLAFTQIRRCWRNDRKRLRPLDIATVHLSIRNFPQMIFVQDLRDFGFKLTNWLSDLWFSL